MTVPSNKSETTKLLEVAKTVELAVSELYTLFADRSDDPRWADLWVGLSAEEKSHAEAIRMQQRLCATGTLKGTPRQRVEAVKLSLRQVIDVIAEFGCKALAQGEALDAAVALERRLADVHASNLLTEIRDPALQKFFAQLAKQDARHIARLEEVQRRGAP